MDLLRCAPSSATTAASAATLTAVAAARATDAMRVRPPLDQLALLRRGTAWVLTMHHAARCVVHSVERIRFDPVSWLA